MRTHDATEDNDAKLGSRKRIDRESDAKYTKVDVNQNQPPGKRQKRIGLTSPPDVAIADSSDASSKYHVNPKTHSMALQETPSADPPDVQASLGGICSAAADSPLDSSDA
jgi:hypothetical protein